MGCFSNGGTSSSSVALQAIVLATGPGALASVVCETSVTPSPAGAVTASHTQITAMPVTSAVRSYEGS